MKEINNHISEGSFEASAAIPSPDCMRLLLSLGDETDPLLSRVLDRSRRRDGLLPTRTSIETGPLSEPGSPVELFHDGTACEEDYTLALIACETMRESGNPGERELAALSLAILEASSIVYRRRLLVSGTMKDADARLAAAAAGLPSEWARLAYAAMRMPLRASA
ncbi:MAG: hypothetical protein RIR10_393 [Planctomycetota bacterium]|jgi:hypothetical protein